MNQPRYEGRLKKWSAERGFGFIAASGGGRDVFVHISAFARDGRPPVEGELLSFEVEADPNGKSSAVRVRRSGDTAPDANLLGAGARPLQMARSRNTSTSWAQKVMLLLMLLSLAALAYNRYAKHSAPVASDAPKAFISPTLPAPIDLPQAAPAPVSAPVPAPATVPQRFSCDGRTHCSQMASCAEATFFLQNCPGVKMDGNRDGVPCEQQWCTK